MARRDGVMDRYSSAWQNLFTFYASPDEYPAVEALRAMGVLQVTFQCGRTARGGRLSNVTSAAARKGLVADVTWLAEVHDLCERMGAALDAEMVRVAGPDASELEPDYRDLVAAGDVLMFVSIRFDDEIRMSASVVIPAAYAVEPGSRA